MTSSSSTRWRMSWAPDRPTSASRSRSLIPSTSRISICSSIRALGAILFTSLGSSRSVDLSSTSGAYASSFFQQNRDATSPSAQRPFENLKNLAIGEWDSVHSSPGCGSPGRKAPATAVAHSDNALPHHFAEVAEHVTLVGRGVLRGSPAIARRILERTRWSNLVVIFATRVPYDERTGRCVLR